jgi:hypothetical protein
MPFGQRRKVSSRAIKISTYVFLAVAVVLIELESCGIYWLPMTGIYDRTYPPYTYETALKKADSMFIRFCKSRNMMPLTNSTDGRDCGSFGKAIVEIDRSGNARIHYPLKSNPEFGITAYLKTYIRTYGNSIGLVMPAKKSDE